MLYQRMTLKWDDSRLRIVVLNTRRHRRLGLRDPVIRSCILSARSIQTFGMNSSIGVAWITNKGTVAKRIIMQPNRLAVGPTAIVVESLDPDDLPPQGTVLTVHP